MAEMTTDLRASELISRSLEGQLDEAEKAELEAYLRDTEQGHSFATLTTLIDSTAKTQSGITTTEASDSRLSDVSKERMRRSIRQAQRDSLAATSAGDLRVAEQETAYFSSKSTDLEEPENRAASSRFTLLQKIGAGGLGTVWLARDEKLRRTVALKEMNASASASAKMAARFQREAEITGHLEHPNVVPLYMSGENPETGQPFYVMRFLGKQTLAEAIREYHARRDSGIDSPIHLHRLLTAFLDICQAIAYAHSRGVIHRDLKPENIALDSFGQVVVLDWGLAKLENESELPMELALSGLEERTVAQTVTGEVVGTPLYMAPEQATGELSDVDARTDVYGLGAILFAILTGDAPHEQSNRDSAGGLRVQQFLDAIASAETPSPRASNPDVPRDLELICMRAMAKEKFARHVSATELAADVEGWMAGKRERQARYDSMRMNGRDLKSRLCVQLRQLGAAAQFMVELPPVQGLLACQKGQDDDYNVWRDRLTQILLALAKSKPNVSGLNYARIQDERFAEIARIERSLYDVSNVRSLPQSRLRESVANTFHRLVIEQFPGEAILDFDCTTAGSVRIVCGVPVFDQETEEPFGMVGAEMEIGNLVRPELEVIGAKDTVYLIDDTATVLYTSEPYSWAKHLPVEETVPRWRELKQALDREEEFIDPDREYYATRLMFPQRGKCIYIVMRADSD